ncbi:protein FAM227B [Ascaphus truei]|uniref:protein FAM227B n=1 Tax=Ascaphus truei TaxID=8439 RepID=UPI003F596DB4
MLAEQHAHHQQALHTQEVTGIGLEEESHVSLNCSSLLVIPNQSPASDLYQGGAQLQSSSVLKRPPPQQKMQKPPATFKEFLAAKHLIDWPENPFAEESLPWAGTLDTKYSLDVITEDLHNSAPMDNKAFAALEAKIAEHASVLDKYVSQILRLPSSEGHPDSLNETFLTEIDVPDLCWKASSLRKTENCIFPGFKSTEFTDLPGHLEAAQVLNCVAKAQNFKGGILKIWRKLFLSETSAAILQDSFWWFFLQRFKPDREEQVRLFDRISDSFVALFWSVHRHVKDLFFKVYPDCLSQAIFAVFYEAFPESHTLFNDEFKSEIMDLIFQWVFGMKPMPCSWTKWNLSWLETSNGNTGVKHSKTPHREMTQTNFITDGRWQLDFNLDGLIQDVRDTHVPRTSPLEDNDVSAIESHYIGPGPEFCQVLFKLGGQSPLVSNYLKMHGVANTVTGGSSHQLKRTELRQLPPAAPTYQDVIKETQKLRKTFTQDYASLEKQTRKELAEIEQQRKRVNWQIKNMKQGISSGGKLNSALLLDKLQHTPFSSKLFMKEGLTIQEVVNTEMDSKWSF